MTNQPWLKHVCGFSPNRNNLRLKWYLPQLNDIVVINPELILVDKQDCYILQFYVILVNISWLIDRVILYLDTYIYLHYT
jgi:hypothetical protein